MRKFIILSLIFSEWMRTFRNLVFLKIFNFFGHEFPDLQRARLAVKKMGKK